MWCHSAIKTLDPLMVKAFELFDEDSKDARVSDRQRELTILTFVRPATKFKGRHAKVQYALCIKYTVFFESFLQERMDMLQNVAKGSVPYEGLPLLVTEFKFLFQVLT